MYLAQFNSGKEKWLQGAVALLGQPVSGRNESPWRAALGHIVNGLLENRQYRLSYRITLDEMGVRRALFVTARLTSEFNLRKSLASFTRLNFWAGPSVSFPVTRPEHDQLCESFPVWRCRLTMPRYRARDTWIACDFNLWPWLSELLNEASVLRHSFSYQINLEPFSCPPDLLRETSKNLLRLGESGAPPALANMQQQLLKRLQSASYLSEELIGAQDRGAGEWLAFSLAARFNRKYGSFRLDPPNFRFERSGHEESVVLARHRVAWEGLDVDETVSECVGSDELVEWSRVVARETFDLVRHQISGLVEAEPPADTSTPLPSVPHLPPVWNGPEDYIFISYKREDLPRIAPILAQLPAWGMKIWYDAGIPGGAEWLAFIEQRIERCTLLLLFVSTASVQSKNVRREAQFADAINRPILSVRIDNAILDHGMALLLSQYQMLDRAAGEFHSKLQRALKYCSSLAAAQQ